MEQKEDPSWEAYPDTILDIGDSPKLAIDLRQVISVDTRRALKDMGIGSAFAVITADNPPVERQQLATGVRERVFAQFRKTPTQLNVAGPSRNDVPQTPVHAQSMEVIMPMHKILTGYFICPRCEEEFELDRMPEKEAVCEDCHVPLEELEEDEDEGDDDQ